MEEKKYELQLNPDYYVVAANDLIRGRQKMTPRENQLLFIAMAQVVKEDKDFKTYTTTVPELAAFMGIDENSLYRDLEGICTKLCQRVVKVKVGYKGKIEKFDIFQWINRATYENGKLTLRLSDEIKPYMLGLAEKGFYTQANLGVLCSFDSYYANRLYQLILCEQGQSLGQKEEWTFTCDELREFFQVKPKEYPRNYDLIKKTIKTAINELNSSDYAYIWDYAEERAKGRGKAILGVSFKALTFESRAEKDSFIKNLPFIELYESGQQTFFGDME